MAKNSSNILFNYSLYISSSFRLSSTKTLLPNIVNIIDGVIRANTALGPIKLDNSSSVLNSEYGSYPSSITSQDHP